MSHLLTGSLLTALHETNSLAHVLSRYFERRNIEAREISSSVRSKPSVQGIKGMIRACEDQTATLDWRKNLLAVAASIGLEEKFTNEAIPAIILEGLITTLPLVQHFPKENYIHIQTKSGVCGIAVWAHSVLGLDVVVRTYPAGKLTETRFESNTTEHIVIDFQQEEMPKSTLTLQSCKTGEKILCLKPEVDMQELEASFRRRGRGFMQCVLERITTANLIIRSRLVEEIGIISCAFAICIAECLTAAIDTKLTAAWTGFEVMSSAECESHIALEHTERKIDMPTSIIFEAAKMLLDKPTLDVDLVYAYTLLLRGKRPRSHDKPPKTVTVLLEQSASIDSSINVQGEWSRLCDVAAHLSTVILAFAQLVDLEKASELPVCASLHATRDIQLYKQVMRWDGSSPILLHTNVWLEIVSVLMQGGRGNFNDKRPTCLASSRGWSVFYNTFGGTDPGNLRKR